MNLQCVGVLVKCICVRLCNFCVVCVCVCVYVFLFAYKSGRVTLTIFKIVNHTHPLILKSEYSLCGGVDVGGLL